jgi:hypothetical protein
MTISPLPNLRSLPQNLPLEGAVRMELVEGVLVFRASSIVQTRIEFLLAKQLDTVLSSEEEEELDCYEEVDDYLGFVNRMVRNASCSQAEIDDPVQNKA